MYLFRESLAQALFIVIKDPVVVLGKALKDKPQTLVSISEINLNYI
jgi:hypothetical protein